MDLWWFGDAWNGRGVSDDPSRRVSIPVGSVCIECMGALTERDRGVITPCSPAVWKSWELSFEGWLYSVCSYHLKCWFRHVESGEVVGEQLARSFGATVRKGEERDEEDPARAYGWGEGDDGGDDGGDDEVAEPGRGWGLR